MFLTKTNILDILKQNTFAPNKKLGQNFLCEKGIIEKIIGHIDSNENVLEIGPGLGCVTFPLAHKVKNVCAVELDKGYFKYLCQEKEKQNLKNINFIHSDILEVDLREILKEETVVFGNLPYYITGPLLMKLIEERRFIKKAIIMVQKEVADRLKAKKGNKIYGKTTVLFDMFASVKHLCNVPATCFFPEPNVDSTVLEIVMQQNSKICLENEDLFFKMVKEAFGQRRKQLVNSLDGMFDKKKLIEILENLGIGAHVRAEELSAEDFARIANALR